MTYTPFSRHLNNDILSAYKNPQASGATGRAVVGGLGAPAARRALRQGATLPSATSSTAAIDALGQGGGLGTVIDSPEPGQGGQGPMESGAAPMGLGSSNSAMESTRGPGRAISTEGKVSGVGGDIAGRVGRSGLMASLDLAQVPGLSKATAGEVIQALGMKTAGGLLPGLVLEGADKLVGWGIDSVREAQHKSALREQAAQLSDEDWSGSSAMAALMENVPGPRPYKTASATLRSTVMGEPTTEERLEALGFNAADANIREELADSHTVPGLSVLGMPVNYQGYDAAVNRSMHDQMLDRVYNRDNSLPGHTVSNASAMAAARDLGKGQGLAVSGSGTPSQGPGTGPGNNATGGLAVGGKDAPGGGMSVGVGGDKASDGDDSIICSELYRQGLMTKRDRMLGYRHSLRHLSPTTLRGYHVWARPVVRAMKRSPRVTAFWRWVWMRRHNEVKRAMGKSTEGDLVGMGIRWVTESFSWVVGACCDLDPVNARFDRKKA